MAARLEWELELDEATWGDLKDELRAMEAAYGSEAMHVRRVDSRGATADRDEVDEGSDEVAPCAVEVRVPLKPLTGEDETHQVRGGRSAIGAGRRRLEVLAARVHLATPRQCEHPSYCSLNPSFITFNAVADPPCALAHPHTHCRLLPH